MQLLAESELVTGVNRAVVGLVADVVVRFAEGVVDLADHRAQRCKLIQTKPEGYRVEAEAEAARNG